MLSTHATISSIGYCNRGVVKLPLNMELQENLIVTEEYWLKISLRLKLRQSSGDQFQDFFSLIMERLHGEDFVRTRSFGRLGDKGADGYLRSSGTVFQCYGAINGDKSRVSYLIEKMKTDFCTARKRLGDIMKEWKMVHNLVDGLPIEAVETLHQMAKANPEIEFGFIGLERFENYVDALAIQDKIELLGPVATNQDSQNLQVEELKVLIDNLVRATENFNHLPEEIRPVPEDKLQANKLPFHWYCLISGGWKNAHIVDSYFNTHYDPLRGQLIARMLQNRYKYLNSQELSPGSIMDHLYEFITGIGTVHPARASSGASSPSTSF